MLVYDVTNRSSFDCLNGWLKEMKAHLSSPADMDSVVCVVCANKVSLVCICGYKSKLIFRFSILCA